MFKRIDSVVGGSVLVLILGGACQTHHTATSHGPGSEQWKPLYQLCMKRSIHQSPALAMHLDMGKLSDRCRALATEAFGRL
jgi:hypothetical protein